MIEILSSDSSYSTTRRLTNFAQSDSALCLPKDILQGGLRTRGLFKSSNERCPLITVITVVYNGMDFIEDTILSIIKQDYDNIEYIVIDGSSSDGTLNIIKRYEHAIDYWISDKDFGVYDAMNKGIKLSTGSWINFMNAGDSFYNESVVSSVKPFLSAEYSVVYGAKITNGLVEFPKPIASLHLGEIFACHQSMFFGTEKIGDELIYDTRYKIYADYELLARIERLNSSFKETSLIISNYADGGISSVISNQKRKDKYCSVLKHYGIIGFAKAVVHRFFRLLK